MSSTERLCCECHKNKTTSKRCWACFTKDTGKTLSREYGLKRKRKEKRIIARLSEEIKI